MFKTCLDRIFYNFKFLILYPPSRRDLPEKCLNSFLITLRFFHEFFIIFHQQPYRRSLHFCTQIIHSIFFEVYTNFSKNPVPYCLPPVIAGRGIPFFVPFLGSHRQLDWSDSIILLYMCSKFHVGTRPGLS